MLAAVLGLMFSFFISTGITTPVRRLLDGTRAVEAGRLDGSIDVTTKDEIGQLTTAFNNMVEQLRHKERLRETFGRYVDPRVVEGLIDPKSLTASDGERRVMTVLFCDMKGFTGLSEGMTPQGLVKVMNHYLSTMSGPIRSHRGIIDKYIGDAIMAYWGPPFTEDGEQAQLACLAAVEMAQRGVALRTELPELLGVRTIPSDCTIRIGIATGEVLVGSIGSEFMMSYTVMGDAVNLASRLEGANKIYGSHFAGLGADDRGRRRRGRISRDRSGGRRRPEPSRGGVRDHGPQGRTRRRSSCACGSAMPRGLPPIAPAVGTTRARRSMRRSKRFPATGRRRRWPSVSRSFKPIRRPRIGTARGASIRNSALRYAARKSSTLRKIPAAPVRTSSGGARDHGGPGARNMFGQHAPDHRQRALGVAAADQQRRRPDRLRFALRKRLAVLADLTDQRENVVAQLLLRYRRQARPGAVAVDAVDDQFERAVDIAAPDFLQRHRHPRRRPARSRRRCRFILERRIEIAAGFGQHQFSQQFGPRLRDAKADMAAAGMAHQVDRAGIEFLDEADDVGDMLRHQIVVADTIPVLGKKAAQAECDDAMLSRQRPEHRIPGAEIAERAVHADQRRACRLGRRRDRPCRSR